MYVNGRMARKEEMKRARGHVLGSHGAAKPKSNQVRRHSELSAAAAAAAVSKTAGANTQHQTHCVLLMNSSALDDTHTLHTIPQMRYDNKKVFWNTE